MRRNGGRRSYSGGHCRDRSRPIDLGVSREVEKTGETAILTPSFDSEKRNKSNLTVDLLDVPVVLLWTGKQSGRKACVVQRIRELIPVEYESEREGQNVGRLRRKR